MEKKINMSLADIISDNKNSRRNKSEGKRNLNKHNRANKLDSELINSRDRKKSNSNSQIKKGLNRRQRRGTEFSKPLKRQIRREKRNWTVITSKGRKKFSLVNRNSPVKKTLEITNLHKLMTNEDLRVN